MRLAALFASVLAACGPDVADGTPSDEPGPEALPPVFAPRDASGEVVTAVDLGRYEGLWYEIGTFPIAFQAACTGSTAQYGAIDATTISVRNRCLLGDLDGQPFVVEGSATLENDAATRLSVRFFGDFGAPYWVVELDGREGDARYAWAVVSGPGQASLWILSRTPTLPEPWQEAILERLEADGFDLDRLVFTEQPEDGFTAEELGGGPL
jgi:apolipoprotein D and lipocalin family protein